jgi:hypothetical protein
MAARGITQAEIDRLAAQGAAELKRERTNSAPREINAAHALDLGQRIPLEWDGVTYRVAPISWRDGVRLNVLSGRIQELEKGGAETNAAELVKTVDEALNLFYMLLDPRPPENPFLIATPWEVGQLLAFFFMCRTKQVGLSRLVVPTAQPSTT